MCVFNILFGKVNDNITGLSTGLTTMTGALAMDSELQIQSYLGYLIGQGSNSCIHISIWHGQRGDVDLEWDVQIHISSEISWVLLRKNTKIVTANT